MQSPGGINEVDLANTLVYNKAMAITVNVHKAKTHLSELIQRALGGEEVIIARDGQPVVKLTPIHPGKITRPAPGIDAGKIIIAPDFDAPLEEFEEL